MQYSLEAANGLGNPDLTLVVPMFNEENGVDLFFKEVFSIVDGSDFSVEVIAVNDGSTDGTLEKLKQWSRRDARVRTFDLSRNFGKDPALCVGIDHARGKALIPLDADLQDPPSLIPEMVAKWREGYEVVFARRIDRKSENFAKRSTAGGFYKVFNWISEISIPENTGDFRLIDRKVVEAVRRLPEHNRFMKGLFAWVGFRQAELTYTRPGREVGLSKWGYWKLWNFALDGITAFSTLPIAGVDLYRQCHGPSLHLLRPLPCVPDACFRGGCSGLCLHAFGRVDPRRFATLLARHYRGVSGANIFGNQTASRLHRA